MTTCNLLVILNDNDMSISPPVGALNRHLARLMSGRFYAAARAGVERVLRVAPPMLDLRQALEEHVKGMIVPATLFEEFGFNYIGPIDGHDLDALIPTLQNIKRAAGSAIPARGHARRARATSWPKPTRCCTTARASSIRRGHQAGQHAGEARPTRRCSATGCATWPSWTRAWSASRRRCAKARAWSSSRSDSRTATSTSASPSSTR